MFSSATFAADVETVKSGETKVTLNGIEYIFYSEAYTADDTAVYARALVKTANGQYVPENTLRAKAILYDSNGKVVRETQVAENSKRATVFAATCSYTTRGTYYAVGEIQILNGSTWKKYTTLKTGTIRY
jgi:hypothetical protein